MTDPIAICNCIQCPILTQYQTTQMISLDYASTFELGPFSANIIAYNNVHTWFAHLGHYLKFQVLDNEAPKGLQLHFRASNIKYQIPVRPPL